MAKPGANIYAITAFRFLNYLRLDYAAAAVGLGAAGAGKTASGY